MGLIFLRKIIYSWKNGRIISGGEEDSMIRGTTPTLEFGIPFSVDLIEKASIVLYQRHSIVIEKTLDDCEAKDQTLIIKLTQLETLKLKEGIKTEIQVRIRTHDGTALASDIISVDTYRILKDGEI